MKVISAIYSLFRNLRLTAFLISALIVLYTMGLVVPQKWLFEGPGHYDAWVNESFLHRALDYIGFTTMYSSPLTLFFTGLFFINLIVVTISRVPIIMRRAMIGGGVDVPAAGDIMKGTKALRAEVPGNPDGVLEGARRFFEARRWHVIMGPDAMLAIRNRYSPFGFLMFHMSFIFCLAGGLALMYTTFTGNLVLTEGQRFDGDIRMFRLIKKEPKILKELPPLGLEIISIKPSFEKWAKVDLLVTLKVEYEGEVKEEHLRVNEPVWRGPINLISENIGISPLFELYGPQGEFVDGGFVSLHVMEGQEDSFQLQGAGDYKFKVKFYADYAVDEKGIEYSRGYEINNPAMHMVIERQGWPVYEGTIKPGELARFDDLSITYLEIRRWVDLLINREYGRKSLIFGFLLAAMGLVMRLVFYQRRMRVGVEVSSAGTVLLYLDGRSEYFSYSYEEEMNRVFKELEGSLKGGSDEA